MPGTNGYQLAETMREQCSALKVLLITDYTNKAAVKSEFLDKGIEMLAKPFTIDPLAHKVESMLSN